MRCKEENRANKALQSEVIDAEIAIKAGEYKIKAVPIADALIAASAYSAGAKVVTENHPNSSVLSIS